jgi:hypothetical protein
MKVSPISVLGMAAQKVRFILDERSIKINVLFFALIAKSIYNLTFDSEFLIMVRKPGIKYTSIAIWIGNTELLSKKHFFY